MENELGKWKIDFVKLISSKWKNAKKIISYCYNLEICMLYEFPLLPGALEFCESQPISEVKSRVALGSPNQAPPGFSRVQRPMIPRSIGCNVFFTSKKPLGELGVAPQEASN